MGDTNIRLLDDNQERQLHGGRLQMDVPQPPREALQRLVSFVAEVVRAKVAIAGYGDGDWVVLAESTSTPALPPPGHDAWLGFGTGGGAIGLEVGSWLHGGTPWTLIGLRLHVTAPTVLIVEGEWTLSAPVLMQLATRLLVEEHARAVSDATQVQTGVAAHRLARALARVSSGQSVCEEFLRHVVRAVPSRIGAMAVPTESDVLAIAATHGYSKTLVEHVRISSGAGVIGSVYQKRTPMCVNDISTIPGLGPRRPRYRTNSFVALPVIAGADVLGVVTVTDRVDGGAFTHHDMSVLRALAAPASLALAREYQRQQAEAFAHAAAIDPLSGLYNRRYLQGRLEEEMERARRTQAPVALLMLDLDDFKGINDRFGHVAGDTVISDVGEILRRFVRAFDVCARFGGEEFAVLMPGNHPESAANTAQRIRQHIEAYRPADPTLTELSLTVSIGLAVGSGEGSARDLVERADRALYTAKRSGKNQVRIDAGPLKRPSVGG